MRLTYTVAPQLSEDTAQQNTVFGPLAGETGVIVDAMQNENSGRLALKPGTTQNLSFGTLNVALGFYLRLDSDCQVSINGNAPLQMFRASQGVTVKARMFFEGIITQISVTAPPDSGAFGVYAVWGDPVEDGQRTQGLPLVVGAPGTAMPVLSLCLSGPRPPTAADGVDGYSWLDTQNLLLYGPKAEGVWPATGRALGFQLFRGSGPPNLADYPLARAGDGYLDQDSETLYELKPSTSGT